MDSHIVAKRFKRFRRAAIARREAIRQRPAHQFAKGTDAESIDFPLRVGNTARYADLRSDPLIRKPSGEGATRGLFTHQRGLHAPSSMATFVPDAI